MLYRENGQFKSTYRADQQMLPIAQDRWSIFAALAFAFLVVPFAAWALYILDMSLLSEQGFDAIAAYFQLPLVKLGMLLFVWAYCHHFCAGIRYLLLDLDIGIELKAARATSEIENCTPSLPPQITPATIAVTPATDHTMTQMRLSGMPIDCAA